MQLQKSRSKQFAFLPSGILIVEPNPVLLAVRADLLSTADYYVSASNEAVPATELRATDVRVAILSQSLGHTILAKLAHEIRLYYPIARILILGKSLLNLDDHLYDELLDDHCRPGELLDALFRLTRHSIRPVAPRLRIGPRNLSLSGLSWISLHKPPAESDPSKEATSAPKKSPIGRDVPADEGSPHLV